MRTLGLTKQARALEVTKVTNCVCDFISGAAEWARELDAVPAEERKKRPLFGVPMSIKESFRVKGDIPEPNLPHQSYPAGCNSNEIYQFTQRSHQHPRPHPLPG